MPDDEFRPPESEAGRTIREALDRALAHATEVLGQIDGFWRNPDVRVPLPPPVEVAKRAAALLMGEQAFETFQRTLNRAAERAMPRVAMVLAGQIATISMRDAVDLFRGSDDALTVYFRRTAWDDLVREVRPIIAEATSEVGVTRSYKQIEALTRPISTIFDPEAMDLDGFVTIHALEGLFFVMAREERRMRADPVGRAKELVLRAFSKRARKKT